MWIAQQLQNICCWYLCASDKLHELRSAANKREQTTTNTQINCNQSAEVVEYQQQQQKITFNAVKASRVAELQLCAQFIESGSVGVGVFMMIRPFVA